MSNERKISGFSDVADTGDEKQNEVDNNINVNNNNNTNSNNNNNEEDDIDRFFRDHKRGKSNLQDTVKGIYFEQAVIDQLDKIKKKNGKGSMSGFVNAAVKKALKEKGYLKD